MTPQEFDVIRAAIKSAYPTFNIMPDKYSIQLWYRMLGDIDFKVCETALQGTDRNADISSADSGNKGEMRGVHNTANERCRGSMGRRSAGNPEIRVLPGGGSYGKPVWTDKGSGRKDGVPGAVPGR